MQHRRWKESEQDPPIGVEFGIRHVFEDRGREESSNVDGAQQCTRSNTFQRTGRGRPEQIDRDESTKGSSADEPKQMEFGMARPCGVLKVVRIDDIDERGEQAIGKGRYDTKRFAHDPARG